MVYLSASPLSILLSAGIFLYQIFVGILLRLQHTIQMTPCIMSNNNRTGSLSGRKMDRKIDMGDLNKISGEARPHQPLSSKGIALVSKDILLSGAK